MDYNCSDINPKPRQPKQKRLSIEKLETNSILKSLYRDNILIKRKLNEIESRLNRVSQGID